MQYIESFAIMLIDENVLDKGGDPKYRDFFKANEDMSIETFKEKFNPIAKRVLTKYTKERWEQISGIPSLDAATDTLLSKVYNILLAGFNTLAKHP